MLPVAKGVSARRDGCGFDLISQALPFGRLWYGQPEDAGNLMHTNKKLVQTTKHLKFHHSVYVVLLDNAVAKHPSILRVNPKRDPLKPCVYVGMTGLPVDHRFENHKNGYQSAWVVKKYGLRLMQELYEHLNPMPFEVAVQMEIELAEDLRAEGYTVTGGK